MGSMSFDTRRLWLMAPSLSHSVKSSSRPDELLVATKLPILGGSVALYKGPSGNWYMDPSMNLEVKSGHQRRKPLMAID